MGAPSRRVARIPGILDEKPDKSDQDLHHFYQFLTPGINIWVEESQLGTHVTPGEGLAAALRRRSKQQHW
jgi:hypothetical protein